ncbi:hypothetical protein JD844_008434 [Phrynosoma platyrhinos]|uniref:NAD kinase 2, mitochondrial n=1 Tax=Phrynosoma platyrhinos TaxID=52577 RepID=A0ABQ7TEL2_PHRPL|nr:hypothetical protein JD844_008434 [Phrynosoma platyrhinos]
MQSFSFKDGSGASESGCTLKELVLTLSLLTCMNNSSVKNSIAEPMLMEDFRIKVRMVIFYSYNLPMSAGAQISEPYLLPVRSLNEVFIGESLSSRVNYKSCKPSFQFSLRRASYYEISVDDGPWEKQKSSGLNICTGTGSKAWSFNINKVANQAVEEILKIAKSYDSLNLPLTKELVQKVTNGYNESLQYSPEEPKMLFSVREPIANRVFSSSRQRGFASKVCIRSRCWDACMVVDGGTSFEFNDGAIASILINTEDALRTILLEE